jgi:hypothetical protein
VVAVEVSQRARAALGNLAPLGGHLRAVGIAIPQQNGQLTGREAHAGNGSGGPPLEAARGEAFGTQPKSLAVVGQEFERLAGAVAEDIDCAAQRIFPERLTTDSGEAINPFTEIDGGQRDKDAALRSELEQQRLSKKACSSGASAGVVS